MSDFNDTAIATGAIASFNNGADDVPVKSCVVTFTPIGGGGTPSSPVAISGVSGLSVTQLGKNLFDKDHANVANGYIDVSAFNTGNANAKTIYIPIKGSQTYTVSKTVGARFSIATSNVIPSSGATFTSRQAGNTSTSLTITAGANDTYLWAWVYLNGTDTGTLDDMLASVQIEVGSTATTYSSYVTPSVVTDTFGQTIYGGTRDLTTDKASVTYALLELAVADMNNSDNYPGWRDCGIKALGLETQFYNEKTNVGQGYSVNTTGSNDILFLPKNSYNNMTQTDWKTNYPNLVIQIVVPLATPTEITGLTSHDISTMLGDNNFYADIPNSETSVEYYKSGYGYTSVTVNQKNGNDELIATKTAKLHKVIYGGEVDVIQGRAEPKNLVPPTNYMTSYFSVADDGTVSQINTTSAPFNWGYANCIFKVTLPTGTYTAIEELLTDSTDASHGVRVFNSSDNMIVRVSNGVKTAGTYSATFTLTEETEVGIACKLYDGTAKLYIVSGSSASEYTPYFAPFNFTPISIETVEGTNVLYANEGDSTVTYRRSAD